MPKYKQVRCGGVRFVFKYDEPDSSLLHIYARHLTSIDDALSVFFDPEASETWNSERRRFERYNASHGLFWFWLDEPNQAVMVITCFTL